MHLSDSSSLSDPDAGSCHELESNHRQIVSGSPHLRPADGVVVQAEMSSGCLVLRSITMIKWLSVSAEFSRFLARI